MSAVTYVQDEEMASPHSQQQQQQQHDSVFRHGASERASSINLGKLSVERQQELFQQNLPAAVRSQMAASIPDQAKSRSDARSGEPAVLDISACILEMVCCMSSAGIQGILQFGGTTLCVQSQITWLCS